MELTPDGHLSWRSLLPEAPRIRWRRFVGGRTIFVDDEEETLGPRSMEVLIEEEANKDRILGKRLHGGEEQQGQGEKRTRRLTEQEIQSHRSFMQHKDKELVAVPESLLDSMPYLPRYFSEEIRRINRVNAERNKLLEAATAKLLVDYDTMGYAEVPLPPPVPGAGRRARVSMDRIYKLRAFMKTKFHSVPVESMYFANEAESKEFTEAQAFVAQKYEEMQALVADALEEHDAKGYIECNADGTIRVAKRPETLEDQQAETS